MVHTGVKGVVRNAVFAQARDELRLNLAVYGVIYALIYRGLYITFSLAYFHDLGYFPAG